MLHRYAVLVGCLVTASGQNLSIGIVAGGSPTAAFERIENFGSVSYSKSKDLLIGPTLEYRLPKSFSIELDGLYRELDLIRLDSALTDHISKSAVVTWEFPLLGKYRLDWSKVHPFIEAGPALRTTGNLNARPSHRGVAAGIGIEMHWKNLDIAPVARYTRWARDNESPFGPESKSDQIELLLSISGRSHFVSRPLGSRVALGVVLGTNLTHDYPASSGPVTFVNAPLPGGGFQTEQGTIYTSGVNSFLAGAEVEVALQKRMYLEAEALSHPLRETVRYAYDNGSPGSSSTSTQGSTWEFPILAKYKFGTRGVKPFVEMGPSFRLPVQHLSAEGISAGGGVEVRLGRLKIAPQIRFTHWAPEAPPVRLNGINLNLVEILTGLLL